MSEIYIEHTLQNLSKVMIKLHSSQISLSLSSFFITPLVRTKIIIVFTNITEATEFTQCYKIILFTNL